MAGLYLVRLRRAYRRNSNPECRRAAASGRPRASLSRDTVTPLARRFFQHARPTGLRGTGVVSCQPRV